MKTIDQAAGPELRELELRLRSVVSGEVSAALGRRALYTSDASNYRILPAAVVAPRSEDDLVAITAVARELRVPITMRGAGTSIAGNAIGPGIIVDMSRHLDRILEIDPVAATATVEPGVVLDDLNAAAAVHGLRVGPDPSTHSRCTIGGMLGNDACGSHSVRWGTTTQSTLGLRIVTADGRRVELGPSKALPEELDRALRRLVDSNLALIRRELPPWPRRVSGYALDRLLPERGFDVAGLLVGSEGTLALTSRATLALVRPPAARQLLVLGFPDDVRAAESVLALLDEAPLTVESLPDELVPDRHVLDGLVPEGSTWLLVEAGGASAGEAREHALRLARAVGRGEGDADLLLLDDPLRQRALWRIREDGAGRAARLPDGTPAWPGFEDAAVPPARLPAFLVELRALLRDRGLRGNAYGHFGEGCLHVRIGFGLDRPGGAERLQGLMEAGADLVASHGGSLSGEHGDGRARSALLPRLFSPELIRAFEQLKAAWDPDDLLNPGVLVRPDPLTAALRRPAPTRIDARPRFAYGDDEGDFRSAVERCIGVGKCVTHHETHAAGPGNGNGTSASLMCPSFRATGLEEHSTRGRARLLQEMLAGSLADEGWRSTAVRDALDLCLACRGCVSECPVAVDMATWKSEFLSHHYRGRMLARPRSHWSLGWLPTWLRLIRRVPSGPALVNRSMRIPPLRRLFAQVAGLEPDRTIPPIAPRSFVEAHEGRSRAAGTTSAAAAVRGRVVLWPDTFTNHLSPQVADAALRVLDAAGFEVVVPASDICCGLTWITTGQLAQARRVLRRTLEAPELTGEESILVLEPSCAAALRRDLVELLPRDPRAAAVARRVTTLAELLDGVAIPGLPAVSDGAAPDGAAAERVLVQPHCHQQAVLGTEADRRLIARMGIKPDPMLSGCCGLAGSFGAEAGHGEISRKVAGLALTPALDAAPAEQEVVADGFSCRTQVAFLSDRHARHLAELLAERLD